MCDRGSHPHWAERPLAVLVLKEGRTISAPELREFLAPAFPSYWLPDAFEVVAEIPKTGTGKFLKSALREMYREWKWPS